MKYKSVSEKLGVLDIQYAKSRKKSLALKYRLKRRTYEVLQSINRFCNDEPKNIIDLGTAEGKMLYEISKTFPKCNCVGIEYNQELINYGKQQFPNLKFIKSDVQSLKKINKDFYDIAIATAVIEHLENPQKFINEVKKVLKNNGILIVTAPDPFWEKVATKVGHLVDDQHHDVPNLDKLKYYVDAAGLEVKLAQKFMISPIGFPFEIQIEKVLRFFKLDFFMANQILVAQKVHK